ncbi:hypothetical protein PoB_005655500 [Plakobranchus ocellatus]|uniref:Integrase catalytic domain-containing protein n=1 Tax=Plakobranchus ocellatus TaxID=259542 RepID=A0AAV4CEC5_9GAST|nr:hypothetical protein PoB_005655500 [Plakobranchus ocellatus]
MAHADFRPPDYLSLQGNEAENWKSWYQQFQNFLTAKEADHKPDTVKIAMLLNCLGPESLERYNNFEFTGEEDRTSYATVIQKFERHYLGMKRTVFSRYQFWTRVKEEGRPFEDFGTHLQYLARPCDFAEMDNMVRDKIVFSIKEKPLKERLLKEDNPTLQKVKDLCLAFEVTQIEIKKMNKAGQKNKTPHKTKVHEVEIGSEEEEQHFWVGELETDKEKRWSVNAKVCDTEIKMKVDTGAETSTIPAKLWEKIKRKPRLRESRMTLKAFGNTKIENEGTATVPISVGVDKCKSRARESIFWPGITKDIELHMNKCTTCAKFRNSNRKEPMISHEIPNRPWAKLGADIFHFGGHDYLLVVDYFSKYLEIARLKTKTATGVKTVLRPIFARHGIPDKLIADNMPFNSYEMKKFAKEWNFTITTSSPTYAQSNGQSERYIQTVKNLIRKAVEENNDPNLALLSYRNTPIYGLENSPAQLLFGRRLQDQVPTATKLLKPPYANVKQKVQAVKRSKNSTMIVLQDITRISSLMTMSEYSLEKHGKEESSPKGILHQGHMTSPQKMEQR